MGYICVHVCIYIYAYVYTYICIYMYVCTYVYLAGYNDYNDDIMVFSWVFRRIFM